MALAINRVPESVGNAFMTANKRRRVSAGSLWGQERGGERGSLPASAGCDSVRGLRKASDEGSSCGSKLLERGRT